MQLLPPIIRSVSTLALRAALVVAAVGLFGACDRHSAEEVPENYGHGSSHERVVPDHQVDSTRHTDHFSDTGGVKDEELKETPAPSEAAPGATPGGKAF